MEGPGDLLLRPRVTALVGMGQLLIEPARIRNASETADVGASPASSGNRDHPPPALRSAHLSQSGGVASGARLGRSRYQGLSRSTIFSMGNEEVTMSNRLECLVLAVEDGSDVRVVALDAVMRFPAIACAGE